MSPKGPLVLEVDAEPALAGPLVATGARLGIEVRIESGRPRLEVAPDDTLAHALRAEVLARRSGGVDLGATAGPRARRALEGLVGEATDESEQVLREEPDGRLTLLVRDRLPIDLGEPPEAQAALRAARARQISASLVAGDDVSLPPGAEERAREITFGPTRTLSDPSSRRVLEAFGIASSPFRLAENAARAAAHARAIGYPVDLRIASPDVSAIDEPMLALTELRTPGEVREGCRALARELRRTSPRARSLGVTVCRHVAGAPRLRLSLERGNPDRMRLELDDPIGRKLARPLEAAAPSDGPSAAAMLARFDGRDVLPGMDTALGRALIDVLVRFARLGIVLADTLTSAQSAPLAPSTEGWRVLGARLAVRGVELPEVTGS